MPGKTFTAMVLQEEGSGACGIELPFDPKEVFGKVRAPVVAAIRGHSYRTTTCVMGGVHFIPLARQHREAAGVRGGERVRVTLTPDDKPREIDPPADLLKAMRRVKGAKAAWDSLSFTHKREHVEAIDGAKKPETRERRIAKAVEMLAERASR